uniref:BBSome interacting protein 1 n=1 Tax=Vombatus ursinus TaxID=29139 RepID=A0A4X2LTK1_VOMUR
MSEGVKSVFQKVLPKLGQLFVEDVDKLKLVPLKSLTLEKLEKMQQTVQETIHTHKMAEKEQHQTNQ